MFKFKKKEPVKKETYEFAEWQGDVLQNLYNEGGVIFEYPEGSQDPVASMMADLLGGDEKLTIYKIDENNLKNRLDVFADMVDGVDMNAFDKVEVSGNTYLMAMPKEADLIQTNSFKEFADNIAPNAKELLNRVYVRVPLNDPQIKKLESAGLEPNDYTGTMGRGTIRVNQYELGFDKCVRGGMVHKEAHYPQDGSWVDRNSRLGKGSLEKSTLVDCRIDNGNLTNSELLYSEISNSKLVSTYCIGSELGDSTLDRVNVQSSDLHNSEMIGGLVRHSNLTDAKIGLSGERCQILHSVIYNSSMDKVLMHGHHVINSTVEGGSYGSAAINPDQRTLTVIKDDHIVDKVSMLNPDIALSDDDLSDLQNDNLEL